MCLAVPGQIISLTEHHDPLLRRGLVNFLGIRKEISLAYVPEARINDYVIVHAGFALAVLDEQEALMSLQIHEELSAFEAAL